MGKSGTALNAFASPRTTGMAVFVFSVSTGKCGIQGIEHAIVKKITFGTATTARRKFNVLEVEYGTKPTNSAFAR